MFLTTKSSIPNKPKDLILLSLSVLLLHQAKRILSTSKAQTMVMVMRLGKEHPVVIFSKKSCCMCHSIKTLIYGFGANPIVYELDEQPNGQQMEKELRALGRKPSVPAVFIGKELIGGPNEIISLHVKGELVPMLLKAKAIWI